MRNLLEKLFWINSEEGYFDAGGNEKLKKAMTVFGACEGKLTAELSGESLETLNRLVDAWGDMNAELSADRFIAGTKTGARLLMELLDLV